MTGCHCIVRGMKNDIFREKVQEKIKGNLILSPGKSAILQLQWKQIAVEVEGAVAEIPQNSPLDVSRIEKQMKKTGNTPFQFEEIQVCVKEEVFLPMQQLNELRRKGLEALEAKIVSQYRRSGSEEVEKEKRGREEKILEEVCICNQKQQQQRCMHMRNRDVSWSRLPRLPGFPGYILTVTCFRESYNLPR